MAKLIAKPVESPQSEADRLAHELASYVRPRRDAEPRPLADFARRDVRDTVARVRGW